MKSLEEMAFDLQNINRYNTFPRLKEESVAEHSFQVIACIKQICDEYEIPDYIRLEAYDAAIMHDIPESITNDITYDAKQMFSKTFKEELKSIEFKISYELDKESALNLYSNQENYKQKLVKALVEYADVQSVVMYAKREVEMGNKFFEDIVVGSSRRWQDASYNLEKVREEFIDAEKYE